MQDISNTVTVPEIVAIGACLIACITSLKSMKIPNWLTFPAAFIGLIVNGLHNNLLASIVGWVLLVFVGCIPPSRNNVPMGAVKLLAAIGAALGPLVGFINYCVFCSVWLLISITMVRGVENDEEREKLRDRQMPLGPMILIATILTVCVSKVSWNGFR